MSEFVAAFFLYVYRRADVSPGGLGRVRLSAPSTRREVTL